MAITRDDVNKLKKEICKKEKDIEQLQKDIEDTEKRLTALCHSVISYFDKQFPEISIEGINNN